jgi:hypothetical protein
VPLPVITTSLPDVIRRCQYQVPLAQLLVVAADRATSQPPSDRAEPVTVAPSPAVLVRKSI